MRRDQIIRIVAVVMLGMTPTGGSAREPVAERTAAETSRMTHWRSKRFGIFIHWGPYSELGGQYEGKTYGGNTEWIMRTAQISRKDYRGAAKAFDPRGFRADDLVHSIGRAGARYLIVTAKHYDGYALFDSKVSDFDSMDVMPSKRDLIAEISKACREEGLPLGYSYALDRDWYHPGGNTLGPPWDPEQAGSRDRYLANIALPQIRELCSNYGPVFVLQANPGGGLPRSLGESFDEAVDSSTVLPWGFSSHGDYSYTDAGMRGHAAAGFDWERCRALGNSWGFREGEIPWQEPETILRELISVASMGGNYLLNIGLDGEGRIPAGAQTVLDRTGAWLARYGESIYGTSRSPFVTHTWDGVATLKKNQQDGFFLYLHVFSQPNGPLVLKDLLPQPISAQLLGSDHELGVSGRPGAWRVETPAIDTAAGPVVIRVQLESYPRIGRGPITASPDGSFRLSLGRGRYPDSRSDLARTAEAADLRLTSFRDPDERAIWEIYSPTPDDMKLQATFDGPAPSDGKYRLIVRSGDRAELELTAHLASAGDGLGGGDARSTPETRSVTFDPSFLIPSGVSKINVSGCAPDDEEGSFPSPVTILNLKLVPNR